ncbi:MAG TPA: Rieske 2Fe-2S domain-containing protein [Magnetospirillum sp.]|nr:Rieske 2Fe-2S domain-containing protein [Magnetospirillum sp.]
MTEPPPSVAQWPAGWWAVCRSRDLRRKPLAITVHGTPMALFRGESGHVGAVEDRCPHRMVPLSAGRIRGDTLACPYHGWRYDAGGCCTAIPGFAEGEQPDRPARRLPAVETREQDGLVWVGASADGALPYRGPLADRPGCHSFAWRTQAWGRLADVAENFLDGFHTHFVHAGLIRTESARRRVTARVRRQSDRVETEYLGEGKQSGVISRLLERDRATSFGRFILPGVAELEYRSPRRTELTITAYFTPAEAGAFTVNAVIATPGGPLLGRLKQAVITPLFRLALRQDADIVRLQTDTIARWGGPRFVSTRLDVMRPHMERLLSDGPVAGLDSCHESELWL